MTSFMDGLPLAAQVRLPRALRHGYAQAAQLSPAGMLHGLRVTVTGSTNGACGSARKVADTVTAFRDGKHSRIEMLIEVSRANFTKYLLT